jgi:hypothetical protein
MKLSLLVVGCFAVGCGGIKAEPVTLTVTPYDSTTPVETTGQVIVPEADYGPDGCFGWMLSPHPPTFADDLTVLQAADDLALESGPGTASKMSLVVGDYHFKGGAEFPVPEKGQSSMRVNFDQTYRFDPNDVAAQTALADLQQQLHDER